MLGFGLAASLLACGGNGRSEENEGPLQLLAAPVVTEPVSQLFGLGEFPLRVCFRSGFNGNTTTATPADYALVRQRVEAAWGGLPRSAVAFSDWISCPTDDSAFIKVYMQPAGSGGNTPWQNGTKAGIMRISLGTSPYDVYTTIHEFGHAIGIRHEQLNPGKPPECTQMQAGESLAASNAVLTSYDPFAVMNYCADNPTQISSKEALFAEMTYPSNTLNHPMFAVNGYQTGNGWVVRVGSTLETDWAGRGALPAAQPTVSWHKGLTTISAQTFTAIAGSYNLSYDFVDFRTVSHTGLSQAISADDGTYAAITGAILG